MAFKEQHYKRRTNFKMPTKLAEKFLCEIAEFCEFGTATKSYKKNNIPYFENEFWTSKQRQSDSLHEISYRACFKPQLPEFFIKRLTYEGDTVFDPFMGRGTTLLQAHLMSRKTAGNDINPLSTLLCRPRLNPVPISHLENTLNQIDWHRGKITRKDLLAFYHPETLKQLEALKKWLLVRVPITNPKDIDPVADWIRMIAISRLSGHSTGFFSVKSMPPNQAVSVQSQLKLNKKKFINPEDPIHIKNIRNLILKKSNSLLKDHKLVDLFSHSPKSEKSFLTGNAWELNDISNDSIHLTITSPPFLDIVNYEADNWLRCWFANIKPENVSISMHKTEQTWEIMIRKVLIEQIRILKIGAFLIFEVGEVRNGTILLEHNVIKAAAGLPLKILGVMINRQDFTKTSNCWGVSNNKSGTNTNRILLFQKV